MNGSHFYKLVTEALAVPSAFFNLKQSKATCSVRNVIITPLLFCCPKYSKNNVFSILQYIKVTSLSCFQILITDTALRRLIAINPDSSLAFSVCVGAKICGECSRKGE